MDLGRYVLFVVPLLLAVAAVVFGEVVVGDATWASLSYHAQVTPSALGAAGQIHGGQWPFWWEGVGLGVPLLEHPAHGALYPFAWLATSPRLYDFVVLGHLLYFALGTALWVRQRGACEVASALWAAISLVAVPWLWLAHNGALFSWAHVPWVMLVAAHAGHAQGAKVGSIVGGALLWAAIGLSGQVAFFFAFAALWLAYCFSAYGRGARWSLVAVGVALLMASPQWLVALAALWQHPGGMSAMAGWAIAWPGGLEAWAQHLLVLAPALAFAPTLLRREPSLLILVGGGVGAAVATQLLFGNVAGVALALGLAAWVAATSTAFSLDVLGTHRLMRFEIPAAAVLLAALLARWHAPGHALVLSAMLVLLAAGAWFWLGSHLRALGIAALGAVLVLAFAAASRTPLVPRAALASAPALWPSATATSASQPARVLRAQQIFDEGELLEASLRRAHNSLQDAMAARFGAANVRAGAAQDAQLAAVIARAAGSMGQFIDRFGIPFAIVPASTVIPSGLELVASYETWGLVRTHPARPRAFVTSEVGVGRGDALLREIFPVGLGTRGISYVALDDSTLGHAERQTVATMPPGSEAIGACTIELARAARVEMRCQHPAAGVAVLLDAWAPQWRATVGGLAKRSLRADGLVRGVLVPPGESLIVWSYQPAAWSVATFMWWAGVLLLQLLAVRWAMTRFAARRASIAS